MYTSTFSFIFYTWTISLVIQFVGSVWLVGRKSNFFIDQGWALGRIVSWLSVSLLIWFVAHTGIPFNTTLGFWGTTLLFVTLSAVRLWQNRRRYRKSFTQIVPFVVTQEILFALGLIGLSVVRSFNPHIQDLEKPMDAGFMASYLRSDSLPAADIWLSGESINYYSFGHFLGSTYTRLLNLEVTYTYNLILALILGLTLSLSFSVVVNLLHFGTKENLSYLKLIIAGLVGSIFVAIGGNTHTIWYYLTKGSFEGYWYADATRFIYNTIHEFPSYSFVVADIHAHVWNLPLVVSLFLAVIYWIKQLFKPVKKYQFTASNWDDVVLFWTTYRHILISSALIGILLGVFVMTSTWDVIIYSLLMAITGFIILLYDYKKIFRLILSAVIVAVLLLVTALPWLLSFTSISEGIALVTEGSPVWQLFALWTGHVTLTVLALLLIIVLLIKKVEKSYYLSFILITSLAITALVLLMLPEIIYFKDIYTGHPRANTMFKFTYQAFVIMSLISGWVVGTLLIHHRLHIIVRVTLLGVVATILGSVLLFPYHAYPGYYGSFSNFQGLHGYQWLQARYPSDYAASVWLKQNVTGQPVILEAVGESYTDFARVSSYTGFPTILGWRVHEWLWRGGFDIPGARTEEVKTIYTQPLSVEAKGLLEQYKVQYIFIGDKEYEAYPDLDSTSLFSLGEIVYSNNQTYIIKVVPNRSI